MKLFRLFLTDLIVFGTVGVLLFTDLGTTLLNYILVYMLFGSLDVTHFHW